ncbi:MAG: ATP-binding cassette domain-containing protein [Desulfarculaceae bacterium]|nr:ATP-binding cassette domain-containing protein [Desulfarculaceae bacterium]
MITLHNVSKFYGKQDVLKAVNLHVGPGERLGLVGPNGAGKSTLLGLMLGTVEPDSGGVYKAKNLRLGYLPQELLTLSGRTVLELAMETGDSLPQVEEELNEVHRLLGLVKDEAELEELLARQGQLQSLFEQLGGYDLEARASRVLAGLGFDQERLHRDVGELSGGWLMRAALARLLLSAPDLILLDEPTNHLDLESLLWLEGYLVSNPASLLLVSHDRVFLDKVANRIVELDQAQLYVYGGNYSHFQEQRQRRRDAQRAAYESQQERVKQIQDFVDRNRTRKDRAKQVQGRLKMLEKMEMVSPPAEDQAIKLELPPAEPSAKVVIELLNVTLAYGEKTIYQDLSLTLRKEDRLALLGRNGAGKSSLLRLMAGQLKPSAGRRLVGGRVKMGVFSQHTMEDLQPENTALDELGSVAGLMAQSAQRTLLGAFLFKGDDVFKKVKVLSGGERARLVLAKLLIQKPNFLLMDEPTNHLDIASRQVLEVALSQYNGTLVLISHDRHLINTIATQVAYVAGGEVTMLPGNYDDFERLWKKKLLPGDEPVPPSPGPSQAKAEAPPKARAKEKPAEKQATADADSGKKSPEQKRAEAQARNERYRRLKPLKDKVAKLEAQVEEASAELDRLVAEMVDPEAFADGPRWAKLTKDHAAAQARVDKLTKKWEKMALELEELESEE